MTNEMPYSAAYYEKNREMIRGKAKMKYDSEKRKERYATQRDEILRKMKTDRSMCPLCNLMYSRKYLPKHVINRHNVPVESVLV